MIFENNAYNLQILRGMNSNKSLLSTDGKTQVDCWNRDDGSGRQQWFFEKADNGGYYVKITNGVNPKPKYLHWAHTGPGVSMVDGKVDNSQIWLVEEVTDSPTCNTYRLKPITRTNMMLSASPDGKVNLYDQDDGSGRQRWQFQNHWVTPQN